MKTTGTFVVVGMAALAMIAAFAADRLGVWTITTPLTETKHVYQVVADYDSVGMLVSLRMKSAIDRSGSVSTTAYSEEVWTRNMITNLPVVVAGETNNFRVAMLNRWNSIDLVPENMVVGWKHPTWMVFTNQPPE